jgi:hypothetical protein
VSSIVLFRVVCIILVIAIAKAIQDGHNESVWPLFFVVALIDAFCNGDARPVTKGAWNRKKTQRTSIERVYKGSCHFSFVLATRAKKHPQFDPLDRRVVACEFASLFARHLVVHGETSQFLRPKFP